jgi:hypothetical protein
MRCDCAVIPLHRGLDAPEQHLAPSSRADRGPSQCQRPAGEPERSRHAFRTRTSRKPLLLARPRRRPSHRRHRDVPGLRHRIHGRRRRNLRLLGESHPRPGRDPRNACAPIRRAGAGNRQRRGRDGRGRPPGGRPPAPPLRRGPPGTPTRPRHLRRASHAVRRGGHRRSGPERLRLVEGAPGRPRRAPGLRPAWIRPGHRHPVGPTPVPPAQACLLRDPQHRFAGLAPRPERRAHREGHRPRRAPLCRAVHDGRRQHRPVLRLQAARLPLRRAPARDDAGPRDHADPGALHDPQRPQDLQR